MLTRLQVSGTTLYGLGVLLFAVNDALLKMLSQKYASYDIIFFRSFFGVLLIFGVQVLRGQLASLKTDRAWVMTLRSLFGFLSIYFSIAHKTLCNSIIILVKIHNQSNLF